MTCRIDAERVALVAERVPATENGLAAASVRHCRPDEGQEREIAADGELAFGVSDFKEAAQLGELLLHRPAPIDGAVYLDLDVARACRFGIAMNQPHQLCFRLAGAVAIDVKGNVLAGANGNTVRVPEALLLDHCYVSVRSLTWRRKAP